MDLKTPKEPAIGFDTVSGGSRMAERETDAAARRLTTAVLVLLIAVVACKPTAQAASDDGPSPEVVTNELERDRGHRRDDPSHSAGGVAETAYDEERRFRSRSPKGLSESYFSCLKRTNYRAVESASCVSSEIERQDARLNRLYGELMEALGEDGKDDLRQSQSAWIKLASSDMELESHIYGNEIVENAQKHENRLFRICERANLLEKYLDTVEL
ncbi:lysozyme inhibitor LprI family protein [Marilutibacter maris]|uniref:lysozyme inhibitor LprI family protein n=1 Tax=Marilutibacter maris TaxID=1605891 RepID=UPI00167CB472|nr:lysozyme inhibitor LprI family protein [Lysobacter maris]